MKPSDREARIAEANAIMATWRSNAYQFTTRKGRLWLTCEEGDCPAILHSIGDRIDRRCMPMHVGSTRTEAMGQLARWIRDWTRASLWCWEYWCSPVVGLGDDRTLELLRASSYGDPQKTACVVCGEPSVKSMDWLTDREGYGVGPCHFGPTCRTKEAT